MSVQVSVLVTLMPIAAVSEAAVVLTSWLIVEPGTTVVDWVMLGRTEAVLVIETVIGTVTETVEFAVAVKN